MAALVLLVLTASFYWTVVGGTMPQQAEEFRPLCSRSCGVPEASGTNDTLPLFQCSCSPSCAIYGDCCHDSPHKNASTSQQFASVCVSVAGRDRYRAVSSCPSHQRSDFCEESLGHLPPVTSRTTNVTYANTFCASCNGDRDDLITWNVELRCPSEDGEGQAEAGDGDDESRIVYSEGDFWKVDEARKSRRLCQFHAHFDDYSLVDGLELRWCDTSDQVTRCSASWTDASVLEKCRSYADPVYFHDTEYRNPHCALCNYLSLEFGDCVPLGVRSMMRGQGTNWWTKFCKGRDLGACLRRLSDASRGRPYSLSRLLNVRFSECVPPDCCEGQLYDYRTKKCKKVRRDG